MGYYDFPHTRNYDQDLGYLINVYNDLKDTYNVLSNEIREQLLEWLDNGLLVKSIDKYIDNKFKPYQKSIDEQLDDIKKTTTTPFNFKGDVKSLEDLPQEGNKVNDTYYVINSKYRVSWNGTGWFQSSQSEQDYMDEYDLVVKSLGGVTADLSTEGSSTNHLKLLEAIKEAHQKKTFVRIPAGDYVFTSSVEIPDNYCVQIYGVMDGFSASMNRQVVGSENHPIHQGSYLMYRGTGRLFTTNVNVILHLNNLMITNENSDLSYRRDGRLVGQDTVSHGKKGKVYVENCYIGGFKNCHGRDNKTVDEQCCVLATRTRYSQCEYVISNCVDSRIVDCSFNNNERDFFFINNCGATTISNCRLEWSKKTNILFDYSSTIHDIIIDSCEFDASYYSSIMINNNSVKKLIISNNIFRRSNRGVDASTETYFLGHISLSANNNDIKIVNNSTVYKNKDDSKPDEDFIPKYAIIIYNIPQSSEFTNVVFEGNDWTGCELSNNFSDYMQLFNTNKRFTNKETEMFYNLGVDIPVYDGPDI